MLCMPFHGRRIHVTRVRVREVVNVVSIPQPSLASPPTRPKDGWVNRIVGGSGKKSRARVDLA